MLGKLISTIKNKIDTNPSCFKVRQFKSCISASIFTQSCTVLHILSKIAKTPKGINRPIVAGDKQWQITPSWLLIKLPLPLVQQTHSQEKFSVTPHPMLEWKCY